MAHIISHTTQSTSSIIISLIRTNIHVCITNEVQFMSFGGSIFLCLLYYFSTKKRPKKCLLGLNFSTKLSCISQWKGTIRIFWGLNFSTYPLLFSTKKRHLIFSSLNGPLLFLTPLYSWLILFLTPPILRLQLLTL